MKNFMFYILWAVLYVMCAIVSLAPLPGTAGTVFSVLLSCLFFLPGSILVYRGVRQKNRKLLRTVRLISILSLLLTLVLLRLARTGYHINHDRIPVPQWLSVDGTSYR